jgi:hypothetical protein
MKKCLSAGLALSLAAFSTVAAAQYGQMPPAPAQAVYGYAQPGGAQAYDPNNQGPKTRSQVRHELAQAERSGWLDELNKTVYFGH